MANPEHDFARIAVSKGYLSQEQAAEALKLHEESQGQGGWESLADIALQKGYLTRAQAETVLKACRQPRLNRIGKFRLLARIGQGGMGTVYKARQETLDKIVALKVMSPRLARQPDFVERFIREAQASGQLNHPNIVLGIDAGEADGYYYFAMEFVDGESLKAVLLREGKLPEGRALEIASAMASALEHAHGANIVHRDIKPGNIFLTHDGVPKLGDLGLAKEISTDHSITVAGVPVGTPYYISPEQVRGEQHVDQRADIYALGATLYHMVAGVVPYDAPTAAIVMTRHLNDEVPDPRAHTPELSESVVAIIHHCMAKKPEERYQTATHLREDIELLLAGKSPRYARRARAAVPAHVRRLAERKVQAAARRRQLAMAGAGVLGLAVIGVVLALVLRPGPKPKDQGVAVPQPKPPTRLEPVAKPPTHATVVPEPPRVDAEALLRGLIERTAAAADRQDVRAAFQQFVRDHAADPAAEKAKAHLSGLEAQWKAIDAFKASVDEQVRQRAFAKALEILANPPVADKSEQFARLVEELAGQVNRAAADYVEAETRKAEALVEANDFARARAIYQGLAALGLPKAAENSGAALENLAKLEAEHVQRQAHRAFAALLLGAAELVRDGKFPEARAHFDPAKAQGSLVLADLLKAAQADVDRLAGLFAQVEAELTKRANQNGSAHIKGMLMPVTKVENHRVWCTIGRDSKDYPVYELTETDLSRLGCIADPVLLPLLELYRGRPAEAKAAFEKVPEADRARYLQQIEWVEAIGREGEAADLLAEARKEADLKNWQKAGDLVTRLAETYAQTGFVEKNRAAINELATRCADAIAEARRAAESIRPFIDATDRCGDLSKMLKTLKTGPIQVGGGWVVDVDNDGMLDVALDLRNAGKDYLIPVFLNETKPGDANLVFRDITKDVGLDTGIEPICWADLDGDGDLDVVRRGQWTANRQLDYTRLAIYENRGSKAVPMFACDPADALIPDLAKEAGYAQFGYGNIAVLDANGDGRADVLAQYIGKVKTLCLFLSGRGKGFRFADASRHAGFISGTGAQTAAPDVFQVKSYPQYVVLDADGDDRADFILNADSGILFANRRGARFVQVAADSVHYETYVTASNNPLIVPAAADYDNDGRVDIFVPQKGRNLLLRNDGKGGFVDAMPTTGPMATDEANSLWATWADVNNDGLLDLFICNDGERNRLYIQKANHAFVDKAEEYGVTGERGEKTNFAAFGDLDRDGDLDMIILRESGHSQVLLNPFIQADNHYYLGVLLRPPLGAIGASVYLIRPPDQIIGLQQVGRVEGYNRQTPREAFFGVGAPGDYLVRVVLSNGTASTHRVSVKATGRNVLVIRK